MTTRANVLTDASTYSRHCSKVMQNGDGQEVLVLRKLILQVHLSRSVSNKYVLINVFFYCTYWNVKLL